MWLLATLVARCGSSVSGSAPLPRCRVLPCCAASGVAISPASSRPCCSPAANAAPSAIASVMKSDSIATNCPAELRSLLSTISSTQKKMPPAENASAAAGIGSFSAPSGTKTSATADIKAPPPKATMKWRHSLPSQLGWRMSTLASRAPMGMADPARSESTTTMRTSGTSSTMFQPEPDERSGCGLNAPLRQAGFAIGFIIGR